MNDDYDIVPLLKQAPLLLIVRYKGYVRYGLGNDGHWYMTYDRDRILKVTEQELPTFLNIEPGLDRAIAKYLNRMDA